MNKIKYSQYINKYTAQPYFIWNSTIKDTAKEEMDDNWDMDDLVKFFSIPDDMSNFDKNEHHYTEIQMKSFNVLENKFDEQFISTTGVEIITEIKIEEKIEHTLNAMKNPNVKIIINPTFSFIYNDFELLSSPKMYDKENNGLTFFKCSASTSAKDYGRIYFDTMVFSLATKIIADSVELCLLATKSYKKNEVQFFHTKKINLTKSTRQTPKGLIDNYMLNDDIAAKKLSDQNYSIHQSYKTGNYSSISKKNPGEVVDIEPGTLIEYIYLFGGYSELDIPKAEKEEQVYARKDTLLNKSKDFFDDYFISSVSYNTFMNDIDFIIASENDNFRRSFTEYDNQKFLQNKYFTEILEEIEHPAFGWSGKLIPKKKIVDSDWETILKSHDIISDIANSQEPIIKDLDSTLKMMNSVYNDFSSNKIVWYDFEAFALPFISLDKTLPYQQIVSQVSVIVTNQMKEVSKENLVIDPLDVSLADFVKIIDAIYDPDAINYIVYNKSYENTRLKEMIALLYDGDFDKADEYRDKVIEIIEKTFDLAVFFETNSVKKYPMILLPELKGRYSIKLLEKYITKHHNELTELIKEYKNLPISNGLMAMETANNRALGIIKTNEWVEKVKQLQEYCENDVRAMIMVYEFIILLRKQLN